ncbi:hypothetical protein LIA77_00361 [Sarocladium implicatum]|nr:hypothetical protein LIA77_00361 [Sarocladium implicatum]
MSEYASDTSAPRNVENDISTREEQLDSDTRSPSITTEELDPIEEYVLAKARQDFVSMAKAFLKTCPGDENRGWGPNDRFILTKFIEGIKPQFDPDEPGNIEPNAVAMMRFRWEVTQNAESLLTHFRLPIPDDQCCLMWDEWHSYQERNYQIPNVGKNYALALDFIGFGRTPTTLEGMEMETPMAPMPNLLQGHPFMRPARYLAAAVALAQLSPERQTELLKEMTEFVVGKRESWVELAVPIAGKKRRREWEEDYPTQESTSALP